MHTAFHCFGKSNRYSSRNSGFWAMLVAWMYPVLEGTFPLMGVIVFQSRFQVALVHWQALRRFQKSSVHRDPGPLLEGLSVNSLIIIFRISYQSSHCFTFKATLVSWSQHVDWPFLLDFHTFNVLFLGGFAILRFNCGTPMQGKFSGIALLAILLSILYIHMLSLRVLQGSHFNPESNHFHNNFCKEYFSAISDILSDKYLGLSFIFCNDQLPPNGKHT